MESGATDHLKCAEAKPGYVIDADGLVSACEPQIGCASDGTTCLVAGDKTKLVCTTPHSGYAKDDKVRLGGGWRVVNGGW